MGKNRRGKGEGSIYRRADGYWCGSVEAGYRWSDETGRQVRRQARVVRARREDVVAALDELRSQVNAGVIPDRTVTVERYLVWFTESVLVPQVAEATAKRYRVRVRVWIAPHVGRYRLVNLRMAHVHELMNALRAQGYAPSTLVDALSFLKQALDFAVADGVLARNVAKPVHGPTVEAKTDDTPSEDEAKALLAAATSNRLGAMAYLCLTYGMRQGEIRKLRWTQVSDDSLTIQRSTTKTDAGARTLPLLPEAKAVLAAHRKTQLAERMAAPSWADDGLVFTDELGRPLDGGACLRWWHKLCASAGVRRARMHAGRHAAATMLFEQGVDVDTVAAILGHRNAATTRKIYLRVREDMKRRGLLKVV